MRLSSKADYAIRAVVELAAAEGDRPMKAEALATAQDIPLNFLENILGELRRGQIVRSQRGSDGGFRLARPATSITIADVIRAVDGPLANVRGIRPEHLDYEGTAASLQEVWVATRAALRSVLEHVTVDDVASGELPDPVPALVANPAAWE